MLNAIQDTVVCGVVLWLEHMKFDVAFKQLDECIGDILNRFKHFIFFYFEVPCVDVENNTKDWDVCLAPMQVLNLDGMRACQLV